MSYLSLASLALAGLAGKTAGLVVFAATPYVERSKGVWRRGGAHVYSLNLQTREVRQITRGRHFDVYPELSPDGRHIHFWRAGDDTDAGYGAEFAPPNPHLYSIGLDGSGLRSLGRSTTIQPTPGLARAMVAAPRGRIRGTSFYVGLGRRL